MQYETIGLDRVEIAATGFRGAEGVVVDREGAVYAGGSDGVIRKLTPDGRMRDVARVAHRPLGIALDRLGNLFVCDGGGAGVLRLGVDGSAEVFADRVDGVSLVATNFAVFDAAGNLYVSNSTDYPLSDDERFMAELREPVPNGALVRLRPDGRGDVVARGLYFPNGVAIDPREEAVYVLQSTKRNCLRIPIRGDGSHGPAEIFVDDFGGLPDGNAFAADGNMIVALPMNDRLVVADRHGRVAPLVEDPEGAKIAMPSNCAFGGVGFDELYVTSLKGDHIARVNLGRRGHRLFHQR